MNSWSYYNMPLETTPYASPFLLIPTNSMASQSQSNPATAASPESYYDLPPESFWVSNADEQDWFNRNAVMQRKTSLKLGFNRNPKSFPHRSEPARKQSRTSLLGLHKARKSFGSDKNPPDKKPLRPLFRSRSEPGGKPPAPGPAGVHVVISDPGSPRVSCTGRIGAKRRGGGGDCNKKTGLSKLIGSLFGTGSGKARPGKGGLGGGR